MVWGGEVANLGAITIDIPEDTHQNERWTSQIFPWEYSGVGLLQETQPGGEWQYALQLVAGIRVPQN